jgi:hypothetical protein
LPSGENESEGGVLLELKVVPVVSAVAGDPSLGTCRLPPGLLLILPSQQLALRSVKPRPATSAVLALLNRGTTQVEWFITARDGQSGYRPNWSPRTDNTSSGRRLINACSFEEVTVTIPSVGIAAQRNHSLGFTLFSNSVTGDAPLAVSYDVSAPANATHSRLLLLPPFATAGSSVDVRIMMYDSDRLPIEHAEGGQDVQVSLRHQAQPGYTASCSRPTLINPSTGGQQAYYTSSCRLPRDVRASLLTGAFRVEASVGGVGVRGSPATLLASCPGNLLTSLTGVCICGLGTFLNPDGQCLPCPPGTFKDTLAGDGCRLCAEFIPGTNTTTGVTGAQSLDQCLCKKGSYMLNR